MAWGQTGDKNVEKIGITKENTFPKNYYFAIFKLFLVSILDCFLS